MESEDYRNSHQARGVDYDRRISATPLDAHMDKWEEYHLMRLLQRLFPNQVPRYMDFACGTGRITQRVEPFAVESYGVDVSESMLAAARRKCPSTRFVCADLTRGSVELGTFDLVTSFRFFGNAQDELRSSALIAINRRLRLGGYLIINNHRNPLSCLGFASRTARKVDAMDLSHAKLKALLIRHGFEITFRRAIGFWIFRFKLTAAQFLQSSFASGLERAFQCAWFAPFSPDSVLAARKVRSVDAAP
jgi:SAM-dependent methyltransferase